MVEIGSGARRNVEDYELSRYACYLIVMNGDPRKEVIALGQTYFAVKIFRTKTKPTRLTMKSAKKSVRP